MPDPSCGHESPSRQQLLTTLVVCAHASERFALTCRAVRSVLQGTRRPDEVLLVVDGNEALYEQLRAALPDDVVLLRNEGHGASEARNTALGVARGEVLVFLDDDAWAEPTWLAELAGAFSDPTVLGAGGLVLPDWERPQLALAEELYWIVGSTYAGHRVDAGPISRPIGASMAARRNALLEIGGFAASFGPRAGVKVSSNEEFATFGELSRRFGPGRIRYVPSAVVHHFAPAARCTLRYVASRSAVEGRSKADVQLLLGAAVMEHDRSYLTKTVVPALWQHLVGCLGAERRREGRALAALVLSTAGAAWGYGTRMLASQGTVLRKRAGAAMRAIAAGRATTLERDSEVQC